MTIFNWSQANHLSINIVIDDIEWDKQVGWWLNGRILGRYLSLFIPWKRKR